MPMKLAIANDYSYGVVTRRPRSRVLPRRRNDPLRPLFLSVSLTT